MNDTLRDDLPIFKGAYGVSPGSRGGSSLYDPSWYVPGGRLTLTSGSPTPIADQTAQTTLFYTPFNHDQIGLWINGVWIMKQFIECSLLASTLAASKMYDVYGFWDNDANVMKLEVGTAWTNDTTRADATPVFMNGVTVKSVAVATRRWLGIVRTTTATKFVDAALASATAGRWVCNAFNKVARHVGFGDSAQRTTVSTTFVQVGSVQVDFICDGTTPFFLIGTTGLDYFSDNTTFAGALAIGSSTSAVDTNCITACAVQSAINASTTLTTHDTNILAAGRYQRFLIFKTSNPAANMYAEGATVAATGRTAPATGLSGTVYC